MSNTKRTKGIFRFLNLFDIVIILLVIALVLVLYFARPQSAVAPAAQSSTVIYTVELTPMVNNSAELIKVGDELVDKLKKYDLGTVKDVSVEVAKKQTDNLVDGGSVYGEMQSQQSAIVTIESACTQSSTQITVGGGFAVRVGATVNVRGPGYNGIGYIISIDRGDAQ